MKRKTEANSPEFWPSPFVPFYLIPRDLRADLAYSPRQCKTIKRIEGDDRDDYAFVSVTPAIPSHTFGTIDPVGSVLMVARSNKRSIFGSWAPTGVRFNKTIPEVPQLEILVWPCKDPGLWREAKATPLGYPNLGILFTSKVNAINESCWLAITPDGDSLYRLMDSKGIRLLPGSYHSTPVWELWDEDHCCPVKKVRIE